MRLDPGLRRLATYLYLQDFLSGEVLELGTRDERADRLLAEHGALRVTHLELAQLKPAALEAGRFDRVLAIDVPAAELEAVALEARRLLKPSGLLVLGCESRDRPGAKSGTTYYDLIDLLEKKWKGVTMIGQAPFAGATLVEYGVKDPEPLLDGTLVDKGERVDWYLALAGSERMSAGGYAVVQVPVPAPGSESVAGPRSAASPVAAASPAPAAAASLGEVKELRERLVVRDRALEEARTAAGLHAQAMAAARAELKERDAYIAELEAGARAAAAVLEAARTAETRAAQAEAKERVARLALATVQGAQLGGRPHDVSVLSPSDSAGAVDGARLAQLEAENEHLRRKEEEARAESWKHLKARSDAEAQAAEVREDTVRKLKDARKLASVELMRAMEEATRKAVGLRDELGRSEKERKEVVAELKSAREELERLRASAPAPAGARDLARAKEEGDAQVLAVRVAADRNVHDELAARVATEWAARAAEERASQLHGRGVALERELRDAELKLEAERERAAQLGEELRRLEVELLEARKQAMAGAAQQGVALESARSDQERLGRTLADVEREARDRAQIALRTRQQLKEREREVETLRQELVERDQRLTALERLHPPASEVERMEVELAQARTRMSQLELEVQRRQAATDRAAQAAAHERARAERLVAEERRALHERNEARARSAESEARASGLELDKERLSAHCEAETERARKAENESRERKERIKQLKRELEDVERRLATVDVVRARLETMEAELRGEEQRMAHLEEAVRRAASNGAPMAPG